MTTEHKPVPPPTSLDSMYMAGLADKDDKNIIRAACEINVEGIGWMTMGAPTAAIAAAIIGQVSAQSLFRKDRPQVAVERLFTVSTALPASIGGARVNGALEAWGGVRVNERKGKGLLAGLLGKGGDDVL